MTETFEDEPAARRRFPFQTFYRAPRDLLLIAAIWIVSLAFVNPVGDFPLNDDWSFGMAVKCLLQTGEFRPTGWTSMPLITQALWGSLFCLPCGFSFTALRLSTLVLSLFGLFALYLLVRQVHPSRLIATGATLTVGLNPIYYALSNTFMTDVPFVALLLVSALFFCRNLRGGSDVDLLCGLVCALAATLCRQLGLAAPLAFLICLLWHRGVAARWVVRAILPLVICLGALLAFNHWLQVSGRVPALYSAKNDAISSALHRPVRLLLEVARHAGTGLLYLGWFSLPMLALLLPTAAQLRKERAAMIFASCAGLLFVPCAVLALAQAKSLMPTEGNIVLAQGVGPLTLRDVHVLHLAHLPRIGRWFWLAVTAAAVLGGTLLVGAAAGTTAAARRCYSRLRPRLDRTLGVFCILCGGIYSVPILAIGGFDRYYMPVLPFLLVGIAALAAPYWHRQTRARSCVAALTLASLSLYAVLGTRDYLLWNRVRWEALNELLRDGKVTAADVDGGFEFNGWYLYDPHYQRRPGKSDYWVNEDSYVLAFGEMGECVVVKQFRYKHLLPPYTGRIVVLKTQPLRGQAPAKQRPGTVE